MWRKNLDEDQTQKAFAFDENQNAKHKNLNAKHKTPNAEHNTKKANALFCVVGGPAWKFYRYTKYKYEAS